MNTVDRIEAKVNKIIKMLKVISTAAGLTILIFIFLNT